MYTESDKITINNICYIFRKLPVYDSMAMNVMDEDIDLEAAIDVSLMKYEVSQMKQIHFL